MISVAASLISIVLPTMISISSLRCRTDGYPDKVRIIQKAMKKGLLAMTPSGHLHGLMRSKTLLAYFIGRLWSGDEVKNDAVTHEPIWVLRSSFPTKLVEDLFEEKGLRDLRKQRRNMPLPQGHELIDSLF